METSHEHKHVALIAACVGVSVAELVVMQALRGGSKHTSKQRVEFLAEILLAPAENVTVAKVEKMERVYGLNSVRNSEIRFRWLRIGLKARWVDAIPRAIAMATEQGRMNFTRPLFRDLYAWEEARSSAIMAFEANRPNMHSTTASLVAKDMNINQV